VAGKPDLHHWDTLAIVLVEGQRIRTATAAAGRARIRAGMTIAEARARCATLHVLPWDEDLIARAVTRATAAFVRASPQVTPAAGVPGLWWVGANGVDASGGEPSLARQLASIARLWHPHARIAVADSCVAARAATWETRPGDRSSDPTPVIIPPGGCAAYLAPAPLGLLTIDDDLRDSLRTLGLHTIGDLARLSAEDVERRWGNTGLAAWRLAHGIDVRRPGLTRLDATRAVTTDLSPSVETTEPVLFLVRAALDRLVHALLADGRAAATLAITLTLDDARGALSTGRPHTITREVQLPRPLARTIPLLERCRALLEDWPLTAPVCGVRVAITATAPLSGAQGELLDTSWRDPAAADAAFARLRSTLGSDAIVRPVARDTHRPEHAAIWERVEDTLPTGLPAHPTRTTTPLRTLRQLDPPERVDVEPTDGIGTPRALRWRDRWIRIHRATGPERLGGEWWQVTYDRDYWCVEDADQGPDLVLYRERPAEPEGSTSWFVHGWYD
jgi:protein ImuB